MREFNLDLLMINNTTAVNCKTEEEANELLEYLNNKGFKWSGGRNIDNPLSYSYNMNREKTCFAFNEARRLNFSGSGFYKFLGYDIISLDDLTIKPKNNFKEYGFEADFEGEIYTSYKSNDNQIFYNGAIWFKPKDDYHYMKPVSWTEKGEVIHHYFKEGYLTDYRLKPIKKEWYENPDNFPCIATKDGKNFAVIESIDYLKRVCIYPRIIDFRPATKEEVLSLLVKE